MSDNREGQMTHTISEVEQILKSRGIFDVRATVIREFDAVIAPIRGLKGKSRQYREYTDKQVNNLTVLLALRILGYSKSFSSSIVAGNASANITERRENFSLVFKYLGEHLDDKTRV